MAISNLLCNFLFFSKCISRLVHHHQGCTFLMRRSIFRNYNQTHDHEYAFHKIDLINVAILKCCAFIIFNIATSHIIKGNLFEGYKGLATYTTFWYFLFLAIVATNQWLIKLSMHTGIVFDLWRQQLFFPLDRDTFSLIFTNSNIL